MTIKLLEPWGTEPAGKVLDLAPQLAQSLIHKNIATSIGNVEQWGRSMPTQDKMVRVGEVVSK